MTEANLTEDERRKAEEVEFHDRRERDRQAMSSAEFLEHYPNKRFYSIANLHREFLEEFLEEHAPSARALDYCCGLGSTSLRLLKFGAHCTGIDISPESVATAKSRAEADGYDAEKFNFAVMDAEALTFPDDSFDLIVCSGVLHHLDINRAYPELARVLAPGGRVVALEALGHNPFIQAYRKLTPKLRTEWEADHIITRKELALAEEHFAHVDVRYFYLTSILPIALGGRFGSRQLMKITNALDSVLLRIPGIRDMAWQVVYTMAGPNRSDG